MKYLFYYLVCINIMALFVYWLDKVKAIYNKRRISECFLFILSLLGGCLGCLGGMFLFRHKTKKFKFYLWNISMIVLWIYLVYRFIL